MNVSNCRMSSILATVMVITLSSWLSDPVVAQSDSLDFSSLFGSSSSSSDKDQFTSITPNQTSGKSKFTNSEHGFEFEFPSNWEVLSPYSSGLNMEGIPVQVASIRSTIDDGIHDLVTVSVLKPSRYLDTDAMQ